MNTNTGTGDGATGQETAPAAGSMPQDGAPDTGAPSQAQNEGQQQETEPSNPFDFMNLPEEKLGSGEEQEPEGEEQQEVEGYELDLGEHYDGNPETRSLLTDCAKEAKLPAKETGAFVQAVAHKLCELQQAREKEANEALQTRWGRNYGANMNAAGRYLQAVAKEEGFSQEEIAQCMNPVVFRLALRAAQAEGEGRATKTGAPVSNKQALDAILNDPNNEMHKILMQPNHHKYRETADYANGLAGMPLF